MVLIQNLRCKHWWILCEASKVVASGPPFLKMPSVVLWHFTWVPEPQKLKRLEFSADKENVSHVE